MTVTHNMMLSTYKTVAYISRLMVLGVLFALSFLGNVSISSAADVLIMADGARGQGMLQRRGDECLIITPKHVVEDSIIEILVTFPDRSEAEAIVLEQYAEDIALLRLKSQPTSGCPERAFNESQLATILNSATEGVLKRRDESGSASLLQVDVVGYDEHRLIRVEPRSSTKSIKQGYSGSVLYLNNQAVGMLINNERSESETGLVLRAETLNASIDPFFKSVQGDKTLHVSLDNVSQFLMADMQIIANQRKFSVGNDASNTNYDMRVLSELKTLNTETDKLAEYTTRIVVTDKLDRVVINESFSASGNSFISLESAQVNARKKLSKRVRQSNLLGDLP